MDRLAELGPFLSAMSEGEQLAFLSDIRMDRTISKHKPVKKAASNEKTRIATKDKLAIAVAQMTPSELEELRKAIGV